jgi:hypothetical protein
MTSTVERDDAAAYGKQLSARFAKARVTHACAGGPELTTSETVPAFSKLVFRARAKRQASSGSGVRRRSSSKKTTVEAAVAKLTRIPPEFPSLWTSPTTVKPPP